MNDYLEGLVFAYDPLEPVCVKRFDLERDLSWREAIPKVTSGQWVYDSAVVSEHGRLTCHIKDKENKNLLRLILNYKNNYKHEKYGVVEAKLGLGTPNFNGWWK